MTIYGVERNETDSKGFGCMPMFQYVKEMRLDAIIQAKKAFGDGGRQVYRAMSVIGEVMLYARKQGLAALSGDEFFRDGPYVLDLIEGTKCRCGHIWNSDWDTSPKVKSRKMWQDL